MPGLYQSKMSAPKKRPMPKPKTQPKKGSPAMRQKMARLRAMKKK
jgi:hypothetical protein